jgi:hypothetical protein
LDLIKCRGCRSEFRVEVGRCPNCGLNLPEPAQLTTWAIGGLLLVVPVILTLQLRNVWHTDGATLDAAVAGERAPELDRETADLDLTRARVACAGLVTKSLHNPSNPSSDEVRDYIARRLQPDQYQVEARVLADDAFGIRRRMTLDCRVTRRSGGWIPRSVKPID